jgi:hypothetical protein
MSAAEHQNRAASAGIHPYLHFPRRVRHHPYIKRPNADPAQRRAGKEPWDVPALCAAYAWPTGLAGGGVIAIVELGGGWLQSDMNLFFTTIGQPLPSITDVSVDGTQNAPGTDQDADGEVALDIQVAAAAYYAATGKAATIRVYWAKDIAPGVRAATADHCDVCSISWGSDEANWGAGTGQDMEQAATDATAAGMIVFAASGDNDSSDGGPKPRQCRSARVLPACGRLWRHCQNRLVRNRLEQQPRQSERRGHRRRVFDAVPLAQLADRRAQRTGSHGA